RGASALQHGDRHRGDAGPGDLRRPQGARSHGDGTARACAVLPSTGGHLYTEPAEDHGCGPRGRGEVQLMAAIEPILMPKLGLAMQEGMLAAWHVADGATIEKGQEIADIETSKIANVFESPVSGTLRRRLVNDGEVVPVGALLAVVADRAVSDGDL